MYAAFAITTKGVTKMKKMICTAMIAAAVCCCASCGCSTGPAETTTGTSTLTTAGDNGGAGMSDSNASVTDILPETAEELDETGESDKNDEIDENKDGNGHYEVTDDGIVTNESDNDSEPDEAAYASSYISAAVSGLSRSKIGWGLGKERDGANRPTDAVQAEEKYSSLGARFLTDEGKICLTFDEGYENSYTAKILDVLKEKNVKAIFFVTYDYCRSSPELVQRMIDEGHTVGNHSYTHPSLPDCTDSEVIEEVSALHDYVFENFGYKMELFRFPKGEFSENALDLVQGLGYTSIFWSFAYSDWDTSAQLDPTEAYSKITSSTHSGIYLLHAVSSTNAEILGSLIDFWRGEGYEVGCEV